MPQARDPERSPPADCMPQRRQFCFPGCHHWEYDAPWLNGNNRFPSEVAASHHSSTGIRTSARAK
jgi:hypothetical protein